MSTACEQCSEQDLDGQTVFLDVPLLVLAQLWSINETCVYLFDCKLGR
jgi:hypothetical protein